ncbi:MAG: F0F1 ATP synthase subunit A [Devosia sp.]|nr:F0F1 ATP synthase subunit A [Devosiaceae bacterium]
MAENPIEPIHQFRIRDIVPFGDVGGIHFGFTNSALLMVVSVVAVIALMLLPTAQRRLVPTRMQLISEQLFTFVADMIDASAGHEAMRFFPLVFSLFTFVLFSNWLGLLPYSFTVASQVIVTATLAVLVFLTVLIFGLMRNGLTFFRLFVPSGIPWFVIWLVVPIEIVSFISRPVSHSLRLWGNMLAGHIVLSVFGGMVVGLASLGVFGAIAAVLPLGMAVALTALELLVGALQAFVFAVLTCVYLHDAYHPVH